MVILSSLEYTILDESIKCAPRWFILAQRMQNLDWNMSCLVKILTWVHVLDNHNFRNNSINTSASNSYFWHRNAFQSGVNSISKMVDQYFAQSSKFCVFSSVQFCSNCTSIWPKYLSNNVWRDFGLPMSWSVMVT